MILVPNDKLYEELTGNPMPQTIDTNTESATEQTIDTNNESAIEQVLELSHSV